MFIDPGHALLTGSFEGAEDYQTFTTRESFRSFERSRRERLRGSIDISPLTG